MSKHIFHPKIVIDAPNPIVARNTLLKILAKLELRGEIYHAQVGRAESR